MHIDFAYVAAVVLGDNLPGLRKMYESSSTDKNAVDDRFGINARIFGDVRFDVLKI